MRFLLVVTALALLSVPLAAQVMERGTGEKRGEPQGQLPTPEGLRFSGRSSQSWSSMVAYGSLQLQGEERFGPAVLFQYTPRRYRGPAFDFHAGVLFQANETEAQNQNDYIPVASLLAPYESPYSDYRNENLFTMPHFSIGLAFLGADVTFYLSEGRVRPYLGLGSSLVFWSRASQLHAAVAPGMKAGLQASISTSFSGFVEARRMVGIHSFIGPESGRFNGMTSAAIGLTFAPQL